MAAVNWPKFSVITPVFNGAKHLEVCIKSVLAQDYPNLEFIILDAGSVDGTVDIIKRYESRIAFWRSHKDDGPPAAFNEGLERATGDLVAIISADDWYEEGTLRAVAEAFMQDVLLEVVACESRIVKYREDGTLEDIYFFRGPKLGIFAGAYPTPNARFYRKQLFDTLGPLLIRDDAGKPVGVCADREMAAAAGAASGALHHSAAHGLHQSVA